MRAHVGLGLAGRQAIAGGQSPQGRRQIVPQTLALFGQVAIVQREADVILDHAEAFPGPIGGGVEDSQDIDLRLSPRPSRGRPGGPGGSAVSSGGSSL